MLTTLDEVREFRRVVESFPHFLASHVWIADGGGTRFVPWAWQVRLARVWRERRQVVILKARQLGVSWLAAAYALWMALTEPGQGCRLLLFGGLSDYRLSAPCPRLRLSALTRGWALRAAFTLAEPR